MTKSKTQSGFSLIEMVVAVGLFAVVSVVISQLFILFLRTQQRASTQGRIQSDARVMMAQIADRIRFGTVDYDAYTATVPRPDTTLFMIDSQGVPFVIGQSLDSANCPSPASTPCLVISESGSAFTPLSSGDFVVENVQFFVDPETNPLADGGPNIQPRVTYSFQIRSSSSDEAQQSPVVLQSTVTTQVYEK